MKKKPIFALSISVLIFAALYLASYCLIAEKSSSRARGAGMYFHYRFFDRDLFATIFFPAAWLEAKAIQIYPEPFLPNPSWATEPQALILQTPNRNICFSSSDPNETKGRDLVTSKYIHDGKGNVTTIKK